MSEGEERGEERERRGREEGKEEGREFGFGSGLRELGSGSAGGEFVRRNAKIFFLTIFPETTPRTCTNRFLDISFQARPTSKCPAGNNINYSSAARHLHCVSAADLSIFSLHHLIFELICFIILLFERRFFTSSLLFLSKCFLIRNC